MIKSNNYQLLHVFRHYFECLTFQVAAIFTFNCVQALKHFLLECLPSVRTKEKFAKTLVQKQQRETVYIRKNICSVGSLYSDKRLNLSKNTRKKLFYFHTFLKNLLIYYLPLSFGNNYQTINCSQKIEFVFRQIKVNLYPLSTYSSGNLAAYITTPDSVSWIRKNTFCPSL